VPETPAGTKGSQVPLFLWLDGRFLFLLAVAATHSKNGMPLHLLWEQSHASVFGYVMKHYSSGRIGEGWQQFEWTCPCGPGIICMCLLNIHMTDVNVHFSKWKWIKYVISFWNILGALHWWGKCVGSKSFQSLSLCSSRCSSVALCERRLSKAGADRILSF